VFTVAAALSALAAVASLLRGGRYVNTEGAVLTPAGPPAPAGAVPAGAVPAGAVPAGAVPAGAVPAGAVPAGAVPAGAVPAGPGPVPAGPVPPAPAAAETLAPAGTSVRGDAASHAESGLASGDASGAPPRRGGARRDAGRGTGPP
jgi:hypothetical protein